MSATRELEAVLEELGTLYREVDVATARLSAAHEGRLRCGRGCSDCCVDDISVFALEAENIRREFGDWLETAAPASPGACAFLDSQGDCRIYSHRPYVCRTQGYPLRWFDESPDGETVELRDICPLNDEGGPPIEALAPADCWTIGPVESRLAALQVAWRRNAARVELRSLFRSDASPHPGAPGQGFEV